MILSYLFCTFKSHLQILATILLHVKSAVLHPACEMHSPITCVVYLSHKQMFLSISLTPKCYCFTLQHCLNPMTACVQLLHWGKYIFLWYTHWLNEKFKSCWSWFLLDKANLQSSYYGVKNSTCANNPHNIHFGHCFSYTLTKFFILCVFMFL